MCGTFDFGCKMKEMIDDWFVRMAEGFANTAIDLFVNGLTWWTSDGTPSPVFGEGTAIGKTQDAMLPIIGIILMMSVLAQAFRMVISRKREPAITIASGLIKFFATNALYGAIIVGAIGAGDAYAKSLIDQAKTALKDGISPQMKAATLGGWFILIILALILFVLGVVQWILALFRSAALIILCAFVPLAASGSMNQATKPWMQKIAPWIIALILYKPIAATIYFLGLTLIQGNGGLGGTGNAFFTIIVGFLIIFIAIFAMPTLMRFFGWITAGIAAGMAGDAMVGVASGGGGGGGGGSGGGGGGNAGNAARDMASNGPGSGGGQSGPSGASGAAGASGPSGASGEAGPEGAGGSPAKGAAEAGAGASSGGGPAAGAGAAGAGGGGAAAGGAAAAGSSAGPGGAAVAAGAVMAVQKAHGMAKEKANDWGDKLGQV